MAHRAEVGELLRDLSDASQPRFGEVKVEPLSQPVARGGAAGPSLIGAALTASSAFGEAVARLAPAAQRGHAQEAVLGVVRDLVGKSESPLAAETPLREAGVDALTAAELASRL